MIHPDGTGKESDTDHRFDDSPNKGANTQGSMPSNFTKGNVSTLQDYTRDGIQWTNAMDNSENDPPLTSEQLQVVLNTLQVQLQKPKPTRPEGATFDRVKDILLADFCLAKKVHAMIEMGARPDVTAFSDAKIVFDDLRSDKEVPPQGAIEAQLRALKAIPDRAKNPIITELRSEYPNISDDAFERSEKDIRGPNYWEALLLTRANNLTIMPLDDYHKTQNKMFDTDYLDCTGTSWLGTTVELLKSGIALVGDFNEDIVNVGFVRPEGHGALRGVRVRAEGILST